MSIKIKNDFSYRSVLTTVYRLFYGTDRPQSWFYRIVFNLNTSLLFLVFLWNVVGTIAMGTYKPNAEFPDVDKYLTNLGTTYGFNQPLRSIYLYFLISTIVLFVVWIAGMGIWRRKKWGASLQIMMLCLQVLFMLLFFNIDYILNEVNIFQKIIWGILMLCSIFFFFSIKRQGNNKLIEES